MINKFPFKSRFDKIVEAVEGEMADDANKIEIKGDLEITKNSDISSIVIDHVSKGDDAGIAQLYKEAEKLGYKNEDVNSFLYDIASCFLGGGKSKTAEHDELDDEQLQKGIKIELDEHTNGKGHAAVVVATKIASDHLAETGNKFKYYDKLEKMEKLK